jgi:hypothetical protein
MMEGPLGVLLAGPAVGTTEVEEDIDGGPLGGGVLPMGLAVATTEVVEDIYGGPVGGVAGGSGIDHHQS